MNDSPDLQVEQAPEVVAEAELQSGPEPVPPSEPERGSSTLTPDDVYFPREYSELLMQLARSIQKHAMYPPAHPALKPAVDTAMQTLEGLLAERSELSVEVGQNQFAIDGSQSDPGHTVFSSFASLLHRHLVAAVAFQKGVTQREMSDFLAIASQEPERTGSALGQQKEGDEAGWPHIRIHPLRYGALSLARGDSATRRPERTKSSSELWRDLSRAALRKTDGGASPIDGLVAEDEDEVGNVMDLQSLVGAVERQSDDPDYASRFADRLAGLSHELKRAGGGPEGDLQQKASQLISHIRPETLERILNLGTDLAERKELVTDAASWMDSESMLKLVRAAATGEGKDISHWYLLMMLKMARYADSEATDLNQEGEAKLRDLVDDLVTGWSDEGAIPEPYGNVLEQAATQDTGSEIQGNSFEEVEPARVLRMSIELEKTGTRLGEAVLEIVRQRNFSQLFETLDEAPSANTAAQAAFEAVATPETVAWILNAPEPDFEALDRVIVELEADAVPPMLEALAHSAQRAVRRHLFSRLISLGEGVAPYAIAYLDDDRWYVRRNMLALIDELGSWPANWSPFDFTRDEHPAVRREALKLLLRTRAQREYALRELLEEPDHRSLALGLAAAMEGAPLEVVPHLINVAEKEDFGEELRGMAIRALAPLQAPEVPETLVHLVFHESGRFRRIFGLRKLKPTSPLVLDGLAGLARHWLRDSKVRRLLKRAANSDDKSVQEAARGRVER